MVDLSAATAPERTAQGVVEPRFIDAMGHMNVTWYVYWFDQGIWTFFERHGLDTAYLARTQRGCFALEENVRYLSELREGEPLDIHTAVVEVRPKTLRFVQYMVAPRAAKVAALREVLAVHVDLGTRRSTAFADDVRAGLEAAVLKAPVSEMSELEAQSFARAWVDAWNRLDVEAVLAHYAEDVVFVSPKAERLVGRPRVEGKDALRAYWTTARERIARLHFTLDRALWSARTETLTILYSAALGDAAPQRAVEVIQFRAGRVVYGEALYGAAAEPSGPG